MLWPRHSFGIRWVGGSVDTRASALGGEKIAGCSFHSLQLHCLSYSVSETPFQVRPKSIGVNKNVWGGGGAGKIL
jgi:hypothetical protein